MYEKAGFLFGEGGLIRCVCQVGSLEFFFLEKSCVLNVAGVFPIFLELPEGIIPLRHESNPPWAVPPAKTNMTMENPPFEDAFPIEIGDFPVSHVSFQGCK